LFYWAWGQFADLVKPNPCTFCFVFGMNWEYQKSEARDKMDYASNMLPRTGSFGEARIKGDSPEHIGFDARLMSIQMLNNLVVNLDSLFAA
jgi:hypothetical protein